jgi:hypothetical protein
MRKDLEQGLGSHVALHNASDVRSNDFLIREIVTLFIFS